MVAVQTAHPETADALTRLMTARPFPFEREAFKLEPADTWTLRGREFVRYLQPVVGAIGGSPVGSRSSE